MFGRLAVGTAVTAMLLALTVGCGPGGSGKIVVRSSDDSARYINNVMAGKSVAKFKLADDSSGIATVAFKDTDPLTDLRTVVTENRDAACFLVGLVAEYTDLVPGSTAPVALPTGALMQIHLDAENNGISSDVTDRTLTVVQRFAQSTFVDAASAACEVIG